jgi:pseudoazurin
MKAGQMQKHSRRTHLKLILGAAGLSGLPGAALTQSAETAAVVHDVQMLNKHPDDPKTVMVFLPDLIRAAPGDTIRFLPVDKGHNAASLKDMLPDGVEAWKSKINEEFEIVVAAEGVHAFQCVPHGAMGMAGMVLVGDVAGNYETLKGLKQRGKLKDKFADLFARADALLAAEAT